MLEDRHVPCPLSGACQGRQLYSGPVRAKARPPIIHFWKNRFALAFDKARCNAQAWRIFERGISLACFARLPCYAQDTQFLPEIDVHLTFSHGVRGYLQAKGDREGGDPRQFTFGPSVEFYLKPLIKLKSATAVDLDDAKSRPLVWECGYRIITAPNTPNENRLQEAATFRFPLFVERLEDAGFVLYCKAVGELPICGGTLSSSGISFSRDCTVLMFWSMFRQSEPGDGNGA